MRQFYTKIADISVFRWLTPFTLTGAVFFFSFIHHHKHPIQGKSRKQLYISSSWFLIHPFCFLFQVYHIETWMTKEMTKCLLCNEKCLPEWNNYPLNKANIAQSVWSSVNMPLKKIQTVVNNYCVVIVSPIHSCPCILPS